MKYAEIKELSDEQLVHKELQLERDMIALRFLHKTQQLEDTSKIGKLRKDIARLRTAQREREASQGLSRDALRNQHRGSFQPGAGAGSIADASAGFLQDMASKMGVGGDESQDGAGALE